MRRIAALDVSTWWGGVALAETDGDGFRVTAEAGLRVSGSHGATLLRLFESVLEAAGWSRDTIDLYGVTRGPGSFTGLRIGLGTVRGLALAAGKPAIGVGTLEAFATAQGPQTLDRLPLLDAGRGEVFGARFDRDSFPPVAVLDPWVGPIEEVLGPDDRPALLFGPGLESYRPRLPALPAGTVVSEASRSIAAAVARLALHRWAAGVPDGWGLSPHYIRSADAVVRTEPP